MHDLSARIAATLRAVADVLEVVVPQLPIENRAALLNLLESGGRVGLESTTDRNRDCAVHLIAIEPDGTRRDLATLSATPRRSETH